MIITDTCTSDSILVIQHRGSVDSLKPSPGLTLTIQKHQHLHLLQHLSQTSPWTKTTAPRPSHQKPPPPNAIPSAAASAPSAERSPPATASSAPTTTPPYSAQTYPVFHSPAFPGPNPLLLLLLLVIVGAPSPHHRGYPSLASMIEYLCFSPCCLAFNTRWPCWRVLLRRPLF